MNCRVSVSGVADPFLDQVCRYHCPIFCILDSSKPSSQNFKRKVWLYDKGDYVGLRREISSFQWDTIHNDDIDIYTQQLTDTINLIAAKYIPNKIVTIRQSSPPWMHNELRKQIRKRKRAYDKAQKTQTPHHWQLYRQIRNKTTTLLRQAKQQQTQKLADKLKNENVSPSDFWKILKQHISTSTRNKGIQILEDTVNFTYGEHGYSELPVIL